MSKYDNIILEGLKESIDDHKPEKTREIKEFIKKEIAEGRMNDLLEYLETFVWGMTTCAGRDEDTKSMLMLLPIWMIIVPINEHIKEENELLKQIIK